MAVGGRAAITLRDPVPGYHAPEGGPAAEAEQRARAGLLGLVADAWPKAARLHHDGAYDWSEEPGKLYREELADLVASLGLSAASIPDRRRS